MSGHHACAVTLPMLTSPSSTGFLAFYRTGRVESEHFRNWGFHRTIVWYLHEYISVQARVMRVYDIDHIKYQPPFYDIDHININPLFQSNCDHHVIKQSIGHKPISGSWCVPPPWSRDKDKRKLTSDEWQANSAWLDTREWLRLSPCEVTNLLSVEW